MDGLAWQLAEFSLLIARMKAVFAIALGLLTVSWAANATPLLGICFLDRVFGGAYHGVIRGLRGKRGGGG